MTKMDMQIQIMLLENKQRKLLNDLNSGDFKAYPMVLEKTKLELKQVNAKLQEYRSVWRMMKA